MTRRGFLARLAAASIIALALLKAPLAEAEAAPEIGVAFNFIRQFDANVSNITRFDVLYGYAVLQPSRDVQVLA